MNALGLIFSNIHDDSLPELTSVRTVASVPIFGRYRLIDFVLSNMVNSGIDRVGVITKRNFRSLMDHVGSGKEWDLARKNGGLILLPPFGEKDSTELYGTRLEALKTVLGFIMRQKEEYVVMGDSNSVYIQNFNSILSAHIASGADITMMYVKRDAKNLRDDNVIINVNGEGRVMDIVVKPDTEGEVNVYADVLVLKRTTLVSLVSDAISRGKRHFIDDLLRQNLHKIKVYAYEHKGYFEEVSSLIKFYNLHMQLLDPEIRKSIFGDWEIYTKVKDSAPTKYGATAICKNSLISDGCQIDGEVYNSVLFRGVKVARGAVLRNCIIMQDGIIGEDAKMNAVITDKRVVVRDRRNLSGAETFPIFIPKDNII
ncbi:MAG: glucose-1-phosphate adenylyltransferase subunit GlgD [Christensenellaceae bacterium]